MKSFVIFLDFDGVLHPKMSGSFQYLNNIFRILDQFKTAKIVISSDWRLQMTFSEIEKMFGIYSSRLMGVTPHISKANRESEILQFVRIRNISQFIAIDDDCRENLFSFDCDWLFKTDFYRGLDDESTNLLIQFIDNKMMRNEE